jgi:hypothetical protein
MLKTKKRDMEPLSGQIRLGMKGSGRKANNMESACK